MKNSGQRWLGKFDAEKHAARKKARAKLRAIAANRKAREEPDIFLQVLDKKNRG